LAIKLNQKNYGLQQENNRYRTLIRPTNGNEEINQVDFLKKEIVEKEKQLKILEDEIVRFDIKNKGKTIDQQVHHNGNIPTVNVKALMKLFGQKD
jgi:hypothetical protein